LGGVGAGCAAHYHQKREIMGRLRLPKGRAAASTPAKRDIWKEQKTCTT
jgi:hypothetical protein